MFYSSNSNDLHVKFLADDDFFTEAIHLQVYPLNLSNYNDVKLICERIKTDPRALAYLLPKSQILHFFAENIDFRAAAFLKQESLSRGADTIVTKHVIDCQAEKSDVLIMGTASQIKNLLQKLNSMDCWGLKEFREKLFTAFSNLNIQEWTIKLRNKNLILNQDTQLMAIINLTPDSFYEHSRINESNILNQAEKFLSEGAAILDLGAESTRPGANAITHSEEISRLIPALKALRKEFQDAIISIDTYKAQTAKIAVSEGADIINDISGFAFDDDMLKTLSELNTTYILSHIEGTPENMRNYEGRENVLDDLINYFAGKINILKESGFTGNIILDPGLGFAKSSSDNLTIIKNIESLKIFGLPVLAGHSRKRFTGGNLSGTLAVTSLLAGRVSLLRVHDVKENNEALLIAKGVKDSIF